MWGVVDEVLARQNKAISVVPESPLTRAIGLIQERGVEFMPTAELAALLGVTETSPSMQGRRLSKQLGVPPGKDEKGVVRGYWITDLMAAAKAGS